MTADIHGHEVLEMMIASGRGFSKKSLEEAIHQRFGRDARFHTCSGENMTARELIEFLEAKGKFVPAAEGFSIGPTQICEH